MRKVSIIIPVYNVEQYVNECLYSVGIQTIADDIECIIVDDCGQDRSMDIVDEYINGYKGNVFFKVLRHDKNSGLSAARNTGIRAAKGEYLYFLDSDDTITPNCIELMFKCAEFHKADLVQSFFSTEYAYQNVLFNIHHPDFIEDAGEVKRTLLNCNVNPVTAANRLVKTSLFREHELYFREGIIHEDNHWTFFLAKYVSRMAYCKEKTYFYRVTSGSIMNEKNIQKEIHSYNVRLMDYIQNIDSMERGAQMKYIFDELRIMVYNKFYDSNNIIRNTVRQLKSKSTYSESMLLSLWYFTKDKDWLNRKVAHGLIRLYNK